jgi:Cu/Ag efflux protein CusF
MFAMTLFAAPLHAEPMQSGPAQNSPMSSTMPMSEGVVRKIDFAAGKITLKHGPIANLDMPGMTMVFRVQPPELLNKVRTGDTVKFRAEEIDGMLTVISIEKVQ